MPVLCLSVLLLIICITIQLAAFIVFVHKGPMYLEDCLPFHGKAKISIPALHLGVPQRGDAVMKRSRTINLLTWEKPSSSYLVPMNSSLFSGSNRKVWQPPQVAHFLCSVRKRNWQYLKMLVMQMIPLCYYTRVSKLSCYGDRFCHTLIWSNFVCISGVTGNLLQVQMGNKFGL